MLNSVPRRYLIIGLFIACLTIIYDVYVAPSHSGSSFTANGKNQDSKQYEISTWRELFQLKADLALSSHSISEYYKVDGFHLTKEQWNILACTLSKPAGIVSGSSIIDFGCGVGAFLYEISTQCVANSNIHVFGIDFAPSMIQIADQWLTPTADRDAGVQHFWVADITNASIVPSNFFTHAVSHSVFQYLHTYQNAFDALSEMARVVKENGTIALMDLNDADKRSEALKSYRKDKNRSAHLSNVSTLNHLFIPKNLIKLWANKLGLKIILILDESTLSLEFYNRSPFRYSVYMKKSIISA